MFGVVHRDARSAPPFRAVLQDGVRAVTDIVGEFPSRVVQPESGEVGARRGHESRAPDAPDEFANGIRYYSDPYARKPLEGSP
jgi:hypothetical protein